jgi:hypothetical protein
MARDDRKEDMDVHIHFLERENRVLRKNEE